MGEVIEMKARLGGSAKGRGETVIGALAVSRQPASGDVMDWMQDAGDLSPWNAGTREIMAAAARCPEAANDHAAYLEGAAAGRILFQALNGHVTPEEADIITDILARAGEGREDGRVAGLNEGLLSARVIDGLDDPICS